MPLSLLGGGVRVDCGVLLEDYSRQPAGLLTPQVSETTFPHVLIFSSEKETVTN